MGFEADDVDCYRSDNAEKWTADHVFLPITPLRAGLIGRPFFIRELPRFAFGNSEEAQQGVKQ